MRELPDDPHDALDDTVRAWVSKGWRIESRLPDQVVVVSGHRVNHVLHFLIGFITFGLWWLFVWLPLGIFGGEKRRVIGIEPVTGEITKRKL